MSQSNDNNRPVIDKRPLGEGRPTISRDTKDVKTTVKSSTRNGKSNSNTNQYTSYGNQTKRAGANSPSGNGTNTGGSKNEVSAMVIVGIIIAAILGCFLMFFFSGASTKKIEQHLNNKEYSSAVDLYNEKISGNEKREEKANLLFSSFIENVYLDFQKEATTYEDVIAIYDEFAKIENQELSELTASKIEEVETLEEFRKIYESGLEFLNDNNFFSALETFAKIENSSQCFEQAQEQIEMCVENIISSVSNKTNIEDIQKDLEIIQKALKALPENDSLIKCQNLLGENYKKSLFEQTEELVKVSDYAGALIAIDKALKVFPDDEINLKSEQYRSDFELKTVENANAFADKGEYEEALNTIEQALTVIDSNALKNLKNDIQERKKEAKEKEAQYTSEKVNFIIHNGSIDSEEEVDSYSFVAPESGVYRFNLSEMKSGFNVRLYVYASDGSEVGGNYAVGNKEGVTCTLSAGEEYTVKVTGRSGTGSYTLKIGQQKTTIDISAKDIVFDSIEYTGQQNVYLFTPQESGIYRFWLSNMISGFDVRLYVFDSLGYEVAGNYSIGNNNGITAEMEAGKQYTICITQRSDGGEYTLSIGKQIPIQNMTGLSSVSNSITFTDQCIVYKYTPEFSGTYKFKLSNMTNEFRIRFQVYDSLEYEIAGNNSVGNEGEITAELKAGEVYKIVIRQRDNFGNYTINVSR